MVRYFGKIPLTGFRKISRKPVGKSARKPSNKPVLNRRSLFWNSLPQNVKKSQKPKLVSSLAPYISSCPEVPLFKGSPVFVLGGGPSLASVDLSLLKGYFVMGVNKAFELGICNVVYFMDIRFYRWVFENKISSDSRENWLSGDFVKVFALSTTDPPEDVKSYIKQDKNLYLVHRVSTLDKSSSVDSFFVGSNSGYGAIMLAAWLGFNPIYLLGYDMSVKDDGSSHWHEGYPKVGENVLSFETLLERYKKTFYGLRAYLDKRGVIVRNLNPDSALDAFEFNTLDNVLGYAQSEEVYPCVL